MINDRLYWSLYSASAKRIAKRTGQPIQHVLRNAMLIWNTYEILPHLGLALYWGACQNRPIIVTGEERVLH